jgi:hypothetical protein
VEALGGTVHLLPRLPQRSTTGLIRPIRRGHAQEAVAGG